MSEIYKENFDIRLCIGSFIIRYVLIRPSSNLRIIFIHRLVGIQSKLHWCFLIRVVEKEGHWLG